MTLTSFTLRTNSSPQVLAWAKAHPQASFDQLAKWVGKSLGWFKEIKAFFPPEFVQQDSSLLTSLQASSFLASFLSSSSSSSSQQASAKRGRRAAKKSSSLEQAWYMATVEALCHSSFQHEFAERTWPNNERLEFLGDSVLQILLSEIFYRAYPMATEGDLSHWRAAAVNAQVWARLALLLKLDQFLLVGKGMAERISLNMLADAWEALWAVAYLHLSKVAFQQAFRKVLHQFEEVYGIDFLTYATTYVDAKSRLQEVLMQQKMAAPVYSCQVLPNQQVRVEMWIGGEYQTVTAASRRQGEAWLAAQALPRFLPKLAAAGKNRPGKSGGKANRKSKREKSKVKRKA